MKKKSETYIEPLYHDVLQLIDKDMFVIGKCYDSEPARLLICKKCKTDKFYVGQGSYYTALKCPTCNYEICIHSG